MHLLVNLVFQISISVCTYLFGCLEFKWWTFIDGGRVVLASCDDSERP